MTKGSKKNNDKNSALSIIFAAIVKNSVVITILVTIVVFISIAVIIPAINDGRINLFSNSNNPVIMQIPKVKTAVTSYKTGSKHHLETRIAFEISPSARKNVDLDKLQKLAAEEIKNLDYDIIAGQDSTAYLMSVIEPIINENLPEEALLEVYIVDLATDFSLPATQEENRLANPNRTQELIDSFKK